MLCLASEPLSDAFQLVEVLRTGLPLLAGQAREVLYWQKTLAIISETSTLLSEVIRTWVFLENLFIHSEAFGTDFFVLKPKMRPGNRMSVS